MNYFNRSISQNPRSVYIVATITSFILSFWLNLKETVINPDGVCYLLSAEAIGHSGIRGAMELCGQAKWPFYSILIYAVSQLTHLSFLVSADLLNSIFSATTVCTFILIAKQLGGNSRILWFAALSILLTHQFNNVRESIIRDHGFWAFYLLSLYVLLKYFAQPRLLMAILFSTTLLIATLFRIEALIFLLLLPWLAWFDTRYTVLMRAKFFFSLNCLLLLTGLMIFVWLLITQQHLDKLTRVNELFHQFQYGLFTMSERFQTMKLALAQYVLPLDSAHDSGLILIVMMLSWYCFSVMSNLSWIYVLLVGYAWLHHILLLSSTSKRVLMSYLFINVLITFGFLMQHVFLSNRYLIALSLVLMLWVPFALNHLMERAILLRYRLSLGLSIFIMLIFSFGSIFDFGYSKSYISSSGNWLAQHIPSKASLYANDFQLMYYSNHFGNSIFTKVRDYVQLDSIANGKWKQYDYLAIRLSHRYPNKWLKILSEMHMKPIRVFSNKRGDRVEIYRVKI